MEVESIDGGALQELVNDAHFVEYSEDRILQQDISGIILEECVVLNLLMVRRLAFILRKEQYIVDLSVVRSADIDRSPNQGADDRRLVIRDFKELGQEFVLKDHRSLIREKPTHLDSLQVLGAVLVNGKHVVFNGNC